jgi:tryptophanyl-tRNA synthetase
MLTDPHRIRRNDPGNPEICSVYTYHNIFNTQERYNQIGSECRAATLGCVDCKKELAEKLNNSLSSFRERRKYYEECPEAVEEILKKGAEKARNEAVKTLEEVRKIIGI